jgi:hypothetical protein
LIGTRVDVSGATVEVSESRAILGADHGDVRVGHIGVEGQEARDATDANAMDIDQTGKV